jgi:hypothetical protein
VTTREGSESLYHRVQDLCREPSLSTYPPPGADLPKREHGLGETSGAQEREAVGWIGVGRFSSNERHHYLSGEIPSTA